MRKLLLLLSFVSFSAFAQVPVATQNSFLEFDYAITDFTTFTITRFEIQIDALPFVSVSIPITKDDAKTLTGDHTYAVQANTLNMPIGNHTFQATGITNFLENGGALERAQDMAAHACPRTTGRIRLFSMEGPTECPILPNRLS